MRYLIALLMGLLLGVLSSDASACHRCGLFGNRCRFQHVAHVAPVVQPTVTNFVFNNTFPAAFTLAPGGSSVYGVQLASGAYAPRPDYFMDRAVRLEELREANSARGYAEFQQSGRLAMQLNSAENLRANNTMLALAAMEKNTGAYQQSLSVRIDSGGNVTYGQPQAVTQAGPPQLLQAQSCGACHDGRGTNGAPKHVVLDGSVEIDQPTLEASFAQIGSGKMPPGAKLTDAQKEIVRASLAQLLGKAPVLAPEPPVPEPPVTVPVPPAPAGNLE